jgi:hypothetical protein
MLTIALEDFFAADFVACGDSVVIGDAALSV